VIKAEIGGQMRAESMLRSIESPPREVKRKIAMLDEADQIGHKATAFSKLSEKGECVMHFSKPVNRFVHTKNVTLISLPLSLFLSLSLGRYFFLSLSLSLSFSVGVCVCCFFEVGEPKKVAVWYKHFEAPRVTDMRCFFFSEPEIIQMQLSVVMLSKPRRSALDAPS
jgi:hypothetical protein